MFTPGKAKFPWGWVCAAASLLLASGWLSPAFSQEYVDGEGCVSCHSEIYGKCTSHRNQHPPFFNQECQKCHGTHEVFRKGGGASPRRAGRDAVLQDRDFLEERTVLLKGLRPGVAYDVRVTFEDPEQNRVSESFTGVEVVNGAAALAGGGDRTPPRISDVRVGPVSAGPFLSTTLTWETDEPATSAVMYGASEGCGQSVRKESVWVKHHRVSLHGLARGREYHFRVQSTDLYGNTSRSGDGQFSMAGSVSPSRFAAETGGGPMEGMGRISVTQARVFLEGSDLGLYLETSKPASVRLEWIESDALPGGGEPDRQGADYDVRLDGLRTGRALTIDACNQSGCHPPASLGISHPVGVPLRNGMPLPDNLPTLEGGIITCVTCHSPHGGTRKYFAQDDFSKKICLTCHTDF